MNMQSIFDAKKDEKDYYDILGCVESSTNEQIKEEYKRLILIHHPDKSLKENDQYLLIKEAYDIVGNPQKRALYDKWRQSGLQIPFKDYAQLSSHAQTIHWQALPSQLTLTDNSHTTSNKDIKSVKPQPSDNLPKIQIKKTSFWNNSNSNDIYSKFRNYDL
ncbi:unnamed protein product [Cunninghamella blakesleeana]